MGIDIYTMASESTFNGFSGVLEPEDAVSSASFASFVYSEAPPSSSPALSAPARRPRSRWLIPEFADNFEAAVVRVPLYYCFPPVVGERFYIKNTAIKRLQNLAFIESRIIVRG